MALGTRKLGSQGPELTTIGFGSWAMVEAGWQFSWGPQNDEESIRAVHAALDQGGNWFDARGPAARGLDVVTPMAPLPGGPLLPLAARHGVTANRGGQPPAKRRSTVRETIR